MAFGGLKGFLEAAANSITNPFAATGSVAVVVGDLVFAVLGEQTSLTVTAVTDNLSNTYSAVNAGTDAGTVTGRAFYSRVTVAGTLTSVSATATGSGNNVAFAAAAIEGPFAVSPLDAAPANTTADITSPFTCPATGTLAQTREVVMAWSVADNNAVWTATSPNLLARTIASQTVIHTIIGYQAVNATTTVAPEFAGTNPGVIVLGTASFMGDVQLPPGARTPGRSGQAVPASPVSDFFVRRNIALLTPAEVASDVVTRAPYFQPRASRPSGQRQQPIGSPSALLAVVPADQPPFMGGLVQQAVLASAWLPPPPLPPAAINLEPPISGPDTPPFIGGAQVSQAALAGWLPPPPRPSSAINLTPPISGPIISAPPFASGEEQWAVLAAWLPPLWRVPSQTTVPLAGGEVAASVVTRAPYFQPRVPRRPWQPLQPVGSPRSLLDAAAVTDVIRAAIVIRQWITPAQQYQPLGSPSALLGISEGDAPIPYTEWQLWGPLLMQWDDA